MAKAADDLDAVRQLAAILEPFNEDDRERILRWARERLGMGSTSGGPPPPALSIASSQTPSPAQAAVPSDIKSFVALKNPKSDRQLAAVVAYFYRFVAPISERKESIAAEDLIEACRKADRGRPTVPSQTLINAFSDGYLDRTADRGKYTINSVGENLVAMVLPGGAEAGGSAKRNRTGRARKPKLTSKTIHKRSTPKRK